MSPRTRFPLLYQLFTLSVPAFKREARTGWRQRFQIKINRNKNNGLVFNTFAIIQRHKNALNSVSTDFDTARS